MIRRSTWILLVLLILLVAAVFYINRQKTIAANNATPTPGGTRFVFTSQDGLPSDIKIVSGSGTSVEVGRDPSGQWVVKAPTSAPADQAQAQAAATQITSLQIVGDIQIGLDVVGLDKPAYTLSVTFTGSKTHTLTVGSLTPIQSGYYTQLDGGKIQVVDKSSLDSLLTLVGNPPYVATATPAVTDTPTPPPSTDTPTSAPAGATGTSVTPTSSSSATTALPSATP